MSDKQKVLVEKLTKREKPTQCSVRNKNGDHVMVNYKIINGEYKTYAI